ncbi:MAG: hypothetical protein ABIZ04_10900 [Opitutus sp.]
MKESKFIELLNLYVDQQISPADAALLEAEIQKRPDRRKIYREYCQMQKACVLLTENFRSEAPAGGKVVESYPEPRRMALITYAMGFAAAAACIALVVVKRPLANSRPAAQSVVAVAPQPATAVPVASDAVAVAIPAVDTTRAVMHPAFPGMVRQQGAANTVAASTRVGFEWMNQVQLERVRADDLWFTTSSSIQAQDLTLRSSPVSQGRVESTAFIFAK